MALTKQPAGEAGADFTEIEYGVLGALVLDARLTAAETFARVRTEDFADGACRHLYETAQGMYANGDAIDALTLCNRAGGAEYRQIVMQLMETTPTTANYEAYIDALLDQSKRRRAAQIGRQIYETAMLGGDIMELQTQAEALAEVMAGRARAEVCDIQDLLMDFFGRVGQPRKYLNWGYSTLNAHIFAEAGDYIVIGARPSVGKTAFALNLALRLARENRVTFFSLETDKRKVADRMMSAASGVIMPHIKRGEVTDDEMALLALNKSKLLPLKFNFVAAAGMTVEDIRAETLRSKSDIIIIDYIGLIDHRNKKLDEYAITTANSKGLQRLARTTGTYVIALSQLNRGGEGMAALRGSGQIEQDADTIIFLQLADDVDDTSPPSKDSRRVLRIAKNKEGICGRIPMWFDGQRQRFTEEWADPTAPTEPLEAELERVRRREERNAKRNQSDPVQQHLEG